MKTIAAIRREKGIDDLVRGYTPNKLDVESTVTGTAFGSLYEKYAAWLNVHFEDIEMMGTFLDTVIEVLTPPQINAFLQGTIKYEEHERYHVHTGDFISRLIKNAYDVGYNDFTLDMPHPIEEIAVDLHGTAAKPLNITINGDVGMCCGEVSEYLSLTLYGNAKEESCFNNVKNSSIIIYGSLGMEFGVEAKNCTFTFYFQQGRRIDSQRFVHGIENCTFKTTDFDKAKWLYMAVPEESKVYFIHPDGKEELMWGQW